MASEQTVELPRPELSAAKRALVEAMLRGQVRSSGIVPRAHRDGAPLSFAQERLWFLDRLEPGSATYNISLARRLGGTLDERALERALGEIVRRHEALRTTFREVDGSTAQVIAPFDGFTLRLDDLSGLTGAEREAEVRRRATGEAMRPFDLTAGPLFRAALLRLGEDHVLLLSMHHIVSDGWSMGVFSRELSALYEAYREGRESPLPALPLQYADYAAWQREHLRGELLERQLSYWRERLAGAPELVELPTDHPRPAVQTFRGAIERIELPGELLERLRTLGRRERATLYMVVLSAFQVLLSKYGGSEDIVVGSPVAGRTRDEVAGLIGFFVNTLVLRTDLSGDPSFREILRRVREATLGAYEHQELPFEKLVAELQPERSLSHSPLFQVSFALDDVEEPESGVLASSTEGVDADVSVAKFDLTLTLGATPQGLRGRLNYSTDLFERGTIVRMLGHLGRVLEQVAADADVRLSRLALAGPEERAQVVAEWNQTERPYPRGVCVHALFDAQVREHPGAIALVWGEESLTYRELDARANQLANHLVRLGVGPDARVGVLLERSVALIVSILAVLKAGGCYVPLDPGYPPGRLRLMLSDSDARVLLSRGELAEVVGAGGLAVVHLDQAAGALASESTEAPCSGATAENLAYIVYTSGSTGKPKGVMVAHRHVVQLVVETDYVRIRPGDRIAQASNACFDALTFEAWGAFLNGATLVGIPRDVLLSPPALRELLREERITTLYQTTALLNQLSREQPDVFAPLREVLFGGQAADADSVRRLLKAGGPERLLHMYGPTETTAWCSWEQVAHVAEDALTVSVGRATGNQRLYLLDAVLNPVPVGVPGEAYVGGDGVVRGYLERPGLTAERFVPDPFAGEPGARLYRTGDRLRWKADGRLEFIGRVDEQVKIRGFRIEPGEIEAALLEHEGVRECAVLAREDAGEKRVVAYVVGDVETDALRAHVRRTLPDYMVPGAFVALERLPLTPNGKLDHEALPAPELASAEEDRYVAPRTPVEEVLAGIWAEVLRLERAGVTESFFDLGGHSLLATRVVSRVRELFGVEVPLRALFEGPTVAGLAGRVEEMRRAGLPVLPPVVPVERTGALPLSFAQERLWFIDRLEPGSAVYNMPMAWRLGGALDEAALERSLGEIVRRHEALRTTFPEMNGSPVQVIAPFDGFTLPVEDLSALGEADREAAVRWRAGEEARQAFDLAAGPLFRAVLLRLGTGDHVLLLSMHHVVSDGWSMGVLFRELSALYAAYREGRESPLPELPVQYADYAVWQRGQLTGEALDRQLSYWRERLSGAPELLELPTDHPRPAVQTYRGATVLVELSPELLERLQALGRSEGATLYMTLLGAFQVLLGRYAGSEDVVVGSPIAGRTRGEVEALIGFFVNTLVLRTDLSGDPSFRETLRRVREATLGAYAHQEAPFERLVAELQPERSLSHSPLFQVMFTLQDAAGGGGALPGLEVSGVGAEAAIAKFDLFLTLAATPQGLRGALNYSTDLFERGTIERMLGHLARVLEQVAENADARLSRLELPAGEERRLLLDEWSRSGEVVDPAMRCVHELFAEQAGRTPDAVALVCGDETLTYAELHRRSDALARRLAALGVGPEVRAGICVERGVEMVVGILGILEAGGAYVPLDPQYPAERLAYMLADAGATLLLAQERLRDRLPAFGGKVVLLDGDDGTGDDARSTEPRAASPENLAYVIYTSGSTGLPKGTEVPHRAIPGFFRGAGYARFGEGAVVLQHSSVSWDALTLELWPALLSGGTCVLYPGQTSEPGALGEQVRRHGVNTLWLTAAYFNLIVDTAPEILAGVAQVMTGGEAVSVPHVRRALELYPRLRLVNGYGPSETTVFATCYPVPAGFDAASVPVGRPVGDRRVYLLDRHVCAVPLGAAGEVCIGGPAAARGYLGRPGLTAERFIPDPFGEPGARLYRSGDRARWRETASAEVRECGSALDPGAEAGMVASHDSERTSALPHSRTAVLEFVGRTDFQVKIRGFRVEPGEVEAVLRARPGVREAAVVVREDQPGDRRLVAYVAGEVAADEVREHLRGQLPEYMVPSAFVVLEALPLTPNGKLDRKALPAPEYAADADRYVAPRTPVEEVLAGIWAEVLRLERVGVTESFFELGGHSLLATRVVSRVRQVLGVEVPLRALFEGPTVAELAEQVEEIRRAGAPALPPVVPIERTGALPLSFAQERLWFIDRLEPGSTVYNMPMAWRLGGALDEAALERSLGEIVRRHEALRTVFAEVDGSPVQVVAPFDRFALPVEDLSGLGEADRDAAVGRRAGEEARRAFDLSAGPLFRAALLRLGAEEHVLLLSMHHIVSDGWSMGVLYRELSALYEAYRKGGESPLPELGVQYADYAVWQRGWLRGEVLQRQLDWWRERLGGAPPVLELPTDRPRPAVVSSRGASHRFRLSAEITRGLRSLARREGATLYMVTHAALDLLLSRWSGQEDLVVGSPIANRTQVGTEGLIGFFVNTLALRVDLSGDPSFQALVRRVRETALGAYAHQELPFERLVEEVAPERGLSHTPLFQVMFQLQNVDSGGGSTITGLRLEPFGGEIRTVRFDLELDLREVGEELLGGLRFRTDLFDAATVERFAAQYQTLLGAVCATPQERLSRLSILPDEEARTLLAYGSGPARDGTGDAPVHRLFAEQAARTPGAPALLSAGESLTYAELDARAGRLARRLRGRAVPGATIAVCLERGPKAVVALLAVWKMGGVYLPLDPSYPVERLSFFLRDSGAKLVVSDLPLAGALLEREADVLLLDPSAEGDLPGAELEPRGGGGPGDLAYLIYTSGSTGTPKAVMVEHAQLTHTLRASLDTLGFAPGDVVAALASTSFDISLLELVTPILAGGAVRIVPHEVARDPETLVEAAGDVTVLHAVPALMRQVVEVVRGGRMLPSLRLLLVGGDSVPPDLLEDMREVFPDARTVVLYGPTEAAIICATYAVPAEGALAGHPLGRPLPGVRLAVRGPRGELAPVGVPGEVWISGGGVARGYLGRPELSAEKFVGAGAERAYRTGDRARWRADGVLEFLGRVDEQVKVRGFRIEPGEVEAVLRGQPGVREAVVLAREDAPGDRRLVAFVVPGADGAQAAGGGREQVSEWETLFDATYAQDEGEEDPTLQLKGWNSSYTGEPIPREEMRAWVENTAERILALGPERVLEVGCGTGLLLFRVAPHTRAYHGTDFSGVALAHVRRHAAGLPQVTLSEREADRLDDYAGAEFDLVVVNSVAQYFPDLGYLLRVLEGAAAALRQGGRIFVGDVRSLPLLGAFHASVELARAPQGLPTGQLRARVRQGMAEEQELLLDPALFEALRVRIPRLGRVEVQVKRGEYDNEVSRFRYDVVLHLDVAAAATAPVVREWSGEGAAVLRALAEGNASALLVRGVPDARVREHVRAYERVSAGGEAASVAAVRAPAAGDAGGIAPEALFALAGELARGIEVRPGAPGTLDVLFHPTAGVARFPAAADAERPWESYANDPQWGRRMRALVPALREAARARLPEYMVPSAFMVLEALPLTPNGKLDVQALPATKLDSGEMGYVAPRRALEAALAGIWAEVLGCTRVGVKENFFDLGGHSLLLVKVQARLRETLGRGVSIVDLFRFTTVAALAEHLGADVEGAGRPEAGAERRWRRGRDRAAIRRALTGQGAGRSGRATHKGDDP